MYFRRLRCLERENTRSVSVWGKRLVVQKRTVSRSLRVEQILMIRLNLIVILDSGFRCGAGKDLSQGGISNELRRD